MWETYFCLIPDIYATLMSSVRLPAAHVTRTSLAASSCNDVKFRLKVAILLRPTVPSAAGRAQLHRLGIEGVLKPPEWQLQLFLLPVLIIDEQLVLNKHLYSPARDGRIRKQSWKKDILASYPNCLLNVFVVSSVFLLWLHRLCQAPSCMYRIRHARTGWQARACYSLTRAAGAAFACRDPAAGLWGSLHQRTIISLRPRHHSGLSYPDPCKHLDMCCQRRTPTHTHNCLS